MAGRRYAAAAESACSEGMLYTSASSGGVWTGTTSFVTKPGSLFGCWT